MVSFESNLCLISLLNTYSSFLLQVGPVSYTFVNTPNVPPHVLEQMGVVTLHTAQCVVEGETFVGTGPTKTIAKNIAAEHAIIHVTALRASNPRNLAATDENGKPLKPHEFMDETPWAQLSSLALYKLFNDWQTQGFDLPQDLLGPHFPGAKNDEGGWDQEAGQGVSLSISQGFIFTFYL